MRKSVFIILLCCSVVMQCNAGFDITECYGNCDKQESACIEYSSSTASRYRAICKEQYNECKYPLPTPPVSTTSWTTAPLDMTAHLLECNKRYASCIKDVLDTDLPSFHNCTGRHGECVGTCNSRMKDENDHKRESRRVWVEFGKISVENTMIALMFTKAGGWVGGVWAWVGTTRLGRWFGGGQQPVVQPAEGQRG